MQNFSLPENFPAELWYHTFSFLDPKSLGCVGLVNKSLHELQKDDTLWRLLSERMGQPLKPNNYCWKEHCITALNWKSGRAIISFKKMLSKTSCSYAAIDGKHYEIEINDAKDNSLIYIKNISDEKKIRVQLNGSFKNSKSEIRESKLYLLNEEGLFTYIEMSTGSIIKEINLRKKLEVSLLHSISFLDSEIVIVGSLPERKNKTILIWNFDLEKAVKQWEFESFEPDFVWELAFPNKFFYNTYCAANYILIKTGPYKVTRYDTNFDPSHELFAEDFIFEHKHEGRICIGLSEKYTAIADKISIKIYENNVRSQDPFREIYLEDRVLDSQKGIFALPWNIKIINDWLFFQAESIFLVFDIYTKELICHTDDIKKGIDGLDKALPIFDFTTDGKLLIFETKGLDDLTYKYKKRFGLPSEIEHLVFDFGSKKRNSLEKTRVLAFSFQEKIESETESLLKQFDNLSENLYNKISTIASNSLNQVSNWFLK